MTGREYLNQIRDTDLNIRCKEREIFRIRQDIMSLQAIDYSKDKVSGGQPITIADKVAKLDAVTEEIMKEWSDFLQERERARFMINQICSTKQRIVLVDRYINGCTWEKVAELIDCSRQNVHNLHKRAIKKFEEIYKKVAII